MANATEINEKSKKNVNNESADITLNTVSDYQDNPEKKDQSKKKNEEKKDEKNNPNEEKANEIIPDTVISNLGNAADEAHRAGKHRLASDIHKAMVALADFRSNLVHLCQEARDYLKKALSK